MLRAMIVVAATMLAGCLMPPKVVGTKTRTTKTSAVVAVSPDADRGAAWVTFRNSTVVRDYAEVDDQNTNAIERTPSLISETRADAFAVWLCRTDAAGVPRCVKARFDGKGVPPAVPAAGP